MMESVLSFIILKFILWIFPSRKIEDVSAVEAAFHDREERRRARKRKRRRYIFRRIQKEKQKQLFVFGRPDSDQMQQKLAKSTQSDGICEKLIQTKAATNNLGHTMEDQTAENNLSDVDGLG